MQKCATVDIDTDLVIDQESTGVKSQVIDHLDTVANYTGTDILLLNWTSTGTNSPVPSYQNGNGIKLEQRLRIAIYGDPESSEHAKMRVLIMIDMIVSCHNVYAEPVINRSLSAQT